MCKTQCVLDAEMCSLKEKEQNGETEGGELMSNSRVRSDTENMTREFNRSGSKRNILSIATENNYSKTYLD